MYDNIYVDNPSDVIHFKVPKGRLNKDEELKKQIKEMNVDIIISPDRDWETSSAILLPLL